MSTQKPVVRYVYSSTNSKKTMPPRRWLWTTLGLSAVATIAASAGALLAVSIASTPLLQSRLSADEAKVFGQDDISTDTNFRLPQLTRPVTILLLGVKVLASDLNRPSDEVVDLGYDALVNSLDGLSDTMVLLRFEPATGRVVVLSIPRDTRTQVEGLGLTKLNTANAQGGPALAATAVSDLLEGITIDRYVRINVQGVEKLVDALGGVSVYVPHDMNYKDDAQHLYIDLKQGEQQLDGAQSLQFLRYRYDQNGDIGRVQRQQTFIRSLLEQTLNPATLTRLPQILSVIQENVDTNLSVEELVALAGFAAQRDRSEVQMLMLPGEFSRPGEYALSYWLPSDRRITALVDQYFGGGRIDFSDLDAADYEDFDNQTAGSEDDRAGASADASQLYIALQDSTGDLSATESLSDVLDAAGYTNVYLDHDWTEPLAITRIVAQRGDVESANALQQALGIGEVRVESTGDLQSDITIQLGQDWLQTDAARSAAHNFNY